MTSEFCSSISSSQTSIYKVSFDQNAHFEDIEGTSTFFTYQIIENELELTTLDKVDKYQTGLKNKKEITRQELSNAIMKDCFGDDWN